MPKATKQKEVAPPKLTPLEQALKDVHERLYFILDSEGGSDEFTDTEEEAIALVKESMEHPDNTDVDHVVLYKAIAVIRRPLTPIEIVK